MSDLDVLLTAAQPATRSVPVCLRGDLYAQMQELQRQLDEAEASRRAADASLASGSRSRELAEQIEALREQMHKHTIMVTLRAMPRRGYRDLQLAHPPREGNERDKALNANEDTWFDALVRACVAEPAFTAEQWERFDGALSEGQWATLANAAVAVNARDVDVPFSRSASRIIQDSAPE